MQRLLGIILVFLATSAALTTLAKQSPPFLQQFSTNTHGNSMSSQDMTPLPSFDHIVILILENKGYDKIFNDDDAPYLQSLAKKYALASNYVAVIHPSLPNYLALIGGDTFGITSDCTNCFLHTENLIDQLETKHKTWRAYMESMPSPCFVGSTQLYAQKHNPFIYFDNIRTNPRRCANIVPYDQLMTDIKKKTLPDFVWITPNMCHNMHDCSIKVGDTWLSQQIPLLLHSDAFSQQHSLLIITFDEGEGRVNQIPTLLIGDRIKQGMVSSRPYSHYSLLHTIEYAWGLSPLTKNVQDSSLMTDFFLQ